MEKDSSSCYNSLMNVKNVVNDENFIPIKVELIPQDTADTNNNTGEQLTKMDLPEALISDRDWKISQVQRHIAEKLKT